ncbi:MAG TPA: peptidoglycan editing factor PgeF [Capsulimonadaceae bacterium]|jgi:hypothetical protein
MAGWKRNVLDGIPVHQASTISWLPGIVQGFSTRLGGVSQKPLDSMNMSLAVGDTPDNVAQNRARAIGALAGENLPYASAAQVHGNHVAVVTEAATEPIADTDALITNVPDIMLLMVFADCVPIYFCDPVKRVVGLAHSGWRGTAVNVSGRTVAAIEREYGAEPGELYCSIGPSISAERYEVDVEVVDALKNAWPGGAVSPMTPKNEFTSKFLCNLRLIVFDQLVSAGIRPERIAVSDECTFRNKKDFFSHRRDSAKGGATGRMAGIIGLRPMDEGFAWPDDDAKTK